MSERTLLTTEEAEQFLGLERGALRHWRSHMHDEAMVFPRVRRGRRFRYCLNDLQAWLDAREEKESQRDTLASIASMDWESIDFETVCRLPDDEARIEFLRMMACKDKSLKHLISMWPEGNRGAFLVSHSDEVDEGLLKLLSERERQEIQTIWAEHYAVPRHVRKVTHLPLDDLREMHVAILLEDVPASRGDHAE